MLTQDQIEQIKRIVNGQIRHTYNEHPEFFTDKGVKGISSISKRITGDVVAYINRSVLSSGKSA